MIYLFGLFGAFSVVLFLTISVVKYFLYKVEILGVHKRYVFITGCDTGFGNLVASTLDKKGVYVIAGCLNNELAISLKEKSSSRLRTVVIDITDRESVGNALKFTQDVLQGKELWGLVNNAGIMPSYAPIEWTSLDTFKQTCDVNLLGTISVTLTFLPLLRQSRGRLVNVCSVVSNCGYPGVADYVVSKAGLKMFTICLRRELFNSGVTTHTIEPGGFRTSITNIQRLFNIMNAAYSNAQPDAQKFYGGNISSYLVNGIKQTGKYTSSNTQAVADAITHALFAKYPKMSYLVGPDAHLFFRMLSWLPEKAADYILGWPKPYGQMCEDLVEGKML